MNKLEKLVYDSLKSNPNVKGMVRNFYQSAYDLLPPKKDFSKNLISVKEGYFFGFHDLCPFSSDNSKILANELRIPLRMPEESDVLGVGYFDLDGDQVGAFNQIGQSRAWNYHKGCRLQWAGENKVAYNDFQDNSLVTNIYNFTEKTTQIYPYPIDSASSCGRYAATFSYGRLEMTMPGYGYVHDDDSYKQEIVTTKTGLYISNLEDGSTELAVSLKELNEKGGLNKFSIDGAHQYITHTLFSHDGKYISFLYRATNHTDVQKRWSQLAVYDIKTGQLYFSPTDEMVSHYVWNRNNEIIAYCRIDGIDSHVLFEQPTLTNYKRVAYPQLNSDGHQSFVDSKCFITDTYPDKRRMANIYCVEIDSNRTELLASLNSPKKFQSKPYKHWCCDLHPRVNRQGNLVCFDSVHTGNRALCVMNIS